VLVETSKASTPPVNDRGGAARCGREEAGQGRWQVHLLAFPAGYAAAVADGDLDGDGVLDSVAEVHAALATGSAVDGGVVKQFECPAIPLP
jgi:hypothetical protein